MLLVSLAWWDIGLTQPKTSRINPYKSTCLEFHFVLHADTVEYLPEVTRRRPIH